MMQSNTKEEAIEIPPPKPLRELCFSESELMNSPQLLEMRTQLEQLRVQSRQEQKDMQEQREMKSLWMVETEELRKRLAAERRALEIVKKIHTEVNLVPPKTLEREEIERLKTALAISGARIDELEKTRDEAVTRSTDFEAVKNRLEEETNKRQELDDLLLDVQMEASSWRDKFNLEVQGREIFNAERESLEALSAVQLLTLRKKLDELENEKSSASSRIELEVQAKSRLEQQLLTKQQEINQYKLNAINRDAEKDKTIAALQVDLELSKSKTIELQSTLQTQRETIDDLQKKSRTTFGSFERVSAIDYGIIKRENEALNQQVQIHSTILHSHTVQIQLLKSASREDGTEGNKEQKVQDITKREEVVAKREEEITKRSEEVSRREEIISKRDEEVEELKLENERIYIRLQRAEMSLDHVHAELTKLQTPLEETHVKQTTTIELEDPRKIELHSLKMANQNQKAELEAAKQLISNLEMKIEIQASRQKTLEENFIQENLQALSLKEKLSLLSVELEESRRESAILRGAIDESSIEKLWIARMEAALAGYEMEAKLDEEMASQHVMRDIANEAVRLTINNLRQAQTIAAVREARNLQLSAAQIEAAKVLTFGQERIEMEGERNRVKELRHSLNLAHSEQKKARSAWEAEIHEAMLERDQSLTALEDIVQENADLRESLLMAEQDASEKETARLKLQLELVQMGSLLDMQTNSRLRAEEQVLLKQREQLIHLTSENKSLNQHAQVLEGQLREFREHLSDLKKMLEGRKTRRDRLLQLARNMSLGVDDEHPRDNSDTNTIIDSNAWSEEDKYV
ncbi:hypothetical protein PROFUN_08378 [Planoprotostelium fungivorum]|uniref:Uncharacterized protein n=1 Tax=Planoprotostelium fungivorum TaxID=1890364 RepID=A0A2P6NJN6_9EUKA|nr:hypothetical protein PROFUN_08378 [Planoprotostelium fungivorum]